MEREDDWSSELTSAGLVERDAACIWHPYTQHGTARDPIPVDYARGAHIHAAGGRRILDCISSWWVTLHGHANEVIARAIAEQAEKLEQVLFAGFTHEPAVRLAEELLRIVPPGLTRVFYSDDGSTSVEVALKMALQYWRNRGERRGEIVALTGAYHGDTFGAMSVSARGAFTDPFGDRLFRVERLSDPLDGDPVGELSDLLESRGDDIAALIVEPLLLGAGGMRVWSESSLRALRELTARHDVLLIADEVLTGFGRTGPLFACDRAGIAPDIICLSKGLTGGFLPLGATVATEEIFNAFLGEDKRLTLFHGHSYTANPLACAAGIASISLLDTACAARRESIERVHEEQMPRVAELPKVVRPRVLGTVAAFDLEGEQGYLSDVAGEVARRCLEEGILIRPLGNVVYLIPPYCVEEEELRGAYDVIIRSLRAEAA